MSHGPSARPSAPAALSARARRCAGSPTRSWPCSAGDPVQFASPYRELQLTLILVYGVAILGLGLLVGRAGQVSLGQSAFFGLGAYAAAYRSATAGCRAALALAVAAVRA